MNLNEVLMKVVSMFLIMSIGVYGGKKKIVTDELQESMTGFIFNITLPFLIITSFSFSYDSSMLSNIVKAFIYSFLSFIILIIVNYICIKPIGENKDVIMKFSNVFSNCGFIGVIAIESIFGAEGMIYASIFNMTFYSLLWIYGRKVYTGNKNESYVNPGTISICLGLLMVIFNIKLPNFIYYSFKVVGDITTPLVLLIIGSIIGEVDYRSVFSDITIYYSVFIKLIIMPGIIFILAKLLNEDSMVISTIILLQAMPTSEFSTIFAKRYKNDYKYSSALMLVSTLLFTLTFPIIVKLVLKF